VYTEFALDRSNHSTSGVISRFGVSVAIAATVSTGFLWSAQHHSPLPATAWSAAFLFVAIEHDVRSLRIPNWLTGSGLAAALALAGATRGAIGVGYAFAGAGVALAALFVPFVLRWLGAGDVKAMMVLGALWGRELVLPTLFWMFVAGGVLALALVVARGELADLATRWGRSAWITLSTGRLTFFGPSPGSAAGGGLPFAVAIGIGAAIYQVWGFPWA
jgi:prepilin peptidase CpaA